MIELKNISKTFSEKTAVDNLSLKIDKGEIVGFLGPNGAGKTTTMRIISGFLIPDAGEVLVDTKNSYENQKESKQKIGYMPENNPLYKEMLVKEALNLVLDIHNVSGELRAQRMDKAVKATGLENVFYRPISELSKGYKQRVGLAQVLLQDPEVLILDEPTEGLDPNQRNEIRELIKGLGKERTVIISTHVMQEVEAMCNRIIIINEGKIIADGSKDEILKNKENIVSLKITSKNKVSASDFGELSTKKVDIQTLEKNKYQINIVFKEANMEDIFASLSNLLKKKDWTILELIQKKQNLEEIFRNLTLK